MAIESNDEYIFGRNLVARIAKSQKQFIPLANLRRQNVRVDAIIARHPQTFCVIGDSRVYLKRYIDEYVKKYGCEPVVVKRGRRGSQIPDEPKATGRQSVLHVQSNPVQDQHAEEWTACGDAC